MALSNRKFAELVRLVEIFVEGDERREECVRALRELLRGDLEQYARGLSRMNEANRQKRERRRADMLLEGGAAFHS